MRRWTVVFMGGVGCVLALTARISALGETGAFEKGAYKDATVYSEKLAYGDAKEEISRIPLAVPREYGRLVAITSNQEMASLWFENEKGVIRNVLVNGQELLMIKRQGNLVLDH